MPSTPLFSNFKSYVNCAFIWSNSYFFSLAATAFHNLKIVGYFSFRMLNLPSGREAYLFPKLILHSESSLPNDAFQKRMR
jgi:hypothetical protein